MNRLSHLQETLKRNILDNEDYQNLEFILLDYNSSDGLREYIQSELGKYVDEKKLFYFRTEEPAKYNMSHSRNLAFKLATGDIVCNIDADNFTGKGFAVYINDVFQSNSKIYLSTHTGKGVKNDVLGRICVKKDDFLAVNGYDESMKHYGFDDYDFSNRLQMYGLKKKIIDDQTFLSAIKHSNKTRMENFNTDSIEKLFIHYISPAESSLYFLFKNGNCTNGTIVSNFNFNAINAALPLKKSTQFRYSLAEKKWLEGSWQCKENNVFIDINDTALVLKTNDWKWFVAQDQQQYRNINSVVLIEEMMFFLHQLANRQIMEANLKNNVYRVNGGKFGEGVVSNKLN